MRLNELPPKTLIKQAHAGVKLINDQYPEAAAILREAITQFDVLREVHQLTNNKVKKLAIEAKPNDVVCVFGKCYRLRYINYYGNHTVLHFQPAKEPLSPYTENDVISLDLANDILIEVVGDLNNV
ncbi:hypothetical protein [Hafnia alvei]|uniref:Uncharacterized protein n=2 Tax=Hafnia alvei TaxID=569 RepID=A0A377PHR1_HAFAL|nr:hypothetical protein [Hafnia alvei]KFC87619.1 hypothetical protein GHAL_2314 [Hafnia alvei ATCC 13337]RLR07865.1 hypothetical protein EAE69_18370 [Hafnia alvei ATCC 13337]WQD26803.1 hypothetical protein U0008_07960 [Hafnia alvei]STQ79760.1 Uncharacterised protein [Hafnia alvei]